METAYINKHDIFATSAEGGKTLSQSELNELLKTMQDLEDTSYLKKIEA